MDLTEKQIAAIAGWAGNQSLIGEVRLFGSRAKGTSHEGSDVDLFISIIGDEEDWLPEVTMNLGRWREELSTSLRLPIDLQLNLEGGTVSAWVEDFSILLYQRAR